MSSDPTHSARIYQAEGADATNDTYIVMLEKTSDKLKHMAWFTGLVAENRGFCELVAGYDRLHCYAARLGGGTLKAVAANADVRAIFQSQHTQLDGKTDNKPDTRINTSWGLQRISQEGPLSGTDPKQKVYTYRTKPISNPHPVNVYVVDTGVDIKHSDLEGRVKWGVTFGHGADKDTDGHGTAIADIIIGKNRGVCKTANVIAIKCCENDIKIQDIDVVNAINWVIYLVESDATQTSSIINLSIGFRHPALGIMDETPLDHAVEKAIEHGIHVVVSAGNKGVSVDAHKKDGKDFGPLCPAHVQGVVTVGATNIRDQVPSWSNFGQCVALFAPGDTIEVAKINAGPTATSFESGTSFAVPYVVGVMACMLSDKGPMSPFDLRFELRASAAKAKLDPTTVRDKTLAKSKLS